jgi:hypothetical protein
VSTRQLEAWDGQPPIQATGTDDDLVGVHPKSSASLDRMRVDKARHPGVLMDRNPRIDLRAQRGFRPYLASDLANTPKKTRIIQNWLADTDAVLTQLPSIAQQSSSMSQGANWNRAIVGGHAAEFRAGYQRGPRTQISSTKRRSNASRPGANNKYICHLMISTTGKSS